jgi:serine phosphatase RsbU (regulator of sigma subunit)
VENYHAIWEFCVLREKDQIDREALKKSFPNLNETELEIEFEKEVQWVINMVSQSGYDFRNRFEHGFKFYCSKTGS